MIDSKKKVSVIMPAYNGARYIREAIESVLEQSYRNIELIIVEDASTDDTYEVIQRFNDSRIICLRNNTNRGISFSTNRGIRESSGYYIALLDDDDIAEQNRIELQVEYMENNTSIDVLGGKTIFVDTDGEVLWYGGTPRNNPKYIRAMTLFRSVDFMNSTIMIRRSFWDESGIEYRENCLGMQDYMFFVEAAKKGNLSSIDKYLVKHRQHGNNATDIIRSTDGGNRIRKWKDIQRMSLCMAGFSLSDEQFQKIGDAFVENSDGLDSIGELLEIIKIFRLIISQGNKVNIDYLPEIKDFCRKSAVHFFSGIDFLEDSNIL